MRWLSQILEISHGSHRSLRSMEGLRGLAVFLVFLVHYTALVQPWLFPDSSLFAIAEGVHNIGNAGVDLFFVLSGYLIYGTLISRPQPFFPYITRRAERIYPAFLVVFGLYLVLSFVFPSESKLPAERSDEVIYLLENVLLLPGLLDIEPMITVAWSLSYEMFYYLLIPLLIVLLNLRGWSKRNRLMFFCALALLIFSLSAVLHSRIRLAMFVAGILLFDTVGPRDEKFLDVIGLSALFCGLIGIWALNQYGAGNIPRFALLFVCFYALCFACFQPESVAARLFSWPPLRWLGNMSYSYYLIHGLTLKGAFRILARVYPATGAGSAAFWLLLPLMFLATLIPAFLLFAAVERPYSLGSAKRKRQGKEPAAGLVPVVSHR